MIALEPTQKLYWNYWYWDTMLLSSITRTDTEVVLKQDLMTFLEIQYRLEPTQKLYWNFVVLQKTARASGLEPTQKLYWNRSDLVFLESWHDSNRHRSCIETRVIRLYYRKTFTRTDTEVVLKLHIIKVIVVKICNSNRHRSCIETWALQIHWL